MITYKAVLLTGTNSVVQLISVTALFILVLVLTYFTTRFVGGYQKSKFNGANIKVLEVMRIANNKTVSLIKIGEKVFAVAMSKDNMTLLGEIDEATLLFPENDEGNNKFDEILKKLKMAGNGDVHKKES